jgi:hypothetical protein
MKRLSCTEVEKPFRNIVKGSWARWCTPVILALRRARQEHLEFKASLGCIGIPSSLKYRVRPSSNKTLPRGERADAEHVCSRLSVFLFYESDGKECIPELIHNVYRNIIIYAQGKNYGGYL